MSALVDLLQYLKRANSTELHLAVGHVPRILSEHELTPLEGWPVLSEEELTALMASAALPEPWRRFASGQVREIAFPLELAGLPSVSVTALRTSLGSAVLLRLVDDHRAADDPLAREVWDRVVSDRPGLVLASGALRIARSALFDQIVEHLDRGRERHVVFVDPPTDLSGRVHRSLVTELRTPTHARDPAAALERAHRLNADVVFIGELREAGVLEDAVGLAESGLKVLVMLQADSVVHAIDQLQAVLPDRRWVDTLAAAVTAALVRGPSGHRLAIEALVQTPAMAAALRAGDPTAVEALLREGKDGMCTMDRTLADLVRSGAVGYEEGAASARDRRRLDSILASFG